MADIMPLDIDLDLSGVTTTTPLLQDATVRVKVKSIIATERDGNKGVRWDLALQEPAQTTDGGTVNPGFVLYVHFDPSQDWMKVKLSRFIDGFLGTGDVGNKKGKPDRPRFNRDCVTRLINAEGLAKVVIRENKKTDYVGNDVTSITPINEPVAA
jgi:hypothetical protein